MPDTRRQENKKPEPGFLQNPTRPGAAVVGSTSAEAAVISSSVSTRSPSRSQPVPVSSNSNADNHIVYRTSNTVHHFGAAQLTNCAHQLQRPPNFPIITQPVNLKATNNNGNHTGRVTTTSAPIPSPVVILPSTRKNPSVPRSQTRVVATATAFPIPNLSNSTPSTGRSDHQHRQEVICAPDANGRVRPNLYPCGPEVLVGLGRQNGFQARGPVNILPNTQLGQPDFNQPYNYIPFQPNFSGGNCPSEAHHYPPIPPVQEVKREDSDISGIVDFAELHHLSCLAATRSAEEARESLNETRRAFFAFTDLTERQRELFEESNLFEISGMAHGTMRIKQETLDRTSPEDSGDQVLDLRKSTSEKLCVWCGKKTSVGEDGVEMSEFCSEICFDQFRRDSFKKRAACMWCNNANHGMINLSLISSLDESKFCSEHCLTQFKVRLFCEETSAHLEQLKEIQLNGAISRSSNSVSKPPALAPTVPTINELITPELWLRKQPSHPNSKKGSPGSTLSSPNQTLSPGCNSPAGSPQSSQHSTSPTTVPNQNQNIHKVVAQVPSQIFATLTSNSGSTGSRRRPISPQDRSSAQPAAKEKSGTSQRKRLKTSSSTLSNSGNFRGQQIPSSSLQQHLLMGPGSHGIVGNGTGNSAHHPRSRKSNTSYTLTSSPQTAATPQVQTSGSSRQAVSLINGNGVNSLVQSGFPTGLRMTSPNQAPTSHGLSLGIGFHLQNENGFASTTANRTMLSNHHPFLGNSIPTLNHLQSIGPQRVSSGNQTYVSTSTQTDPSTGKDENNEGSGNKYSFLPPVTVLVPFPIPIPLPIPIPIFLGGQFGNWAKSCTKDGPVPSSSGAGNKGDAKASEKKEVKEGDEKKGSVNEDIIEEGEIVGEEEATEEQINTPSDDKSTAHRDTKTD